MNLFGLMIKRLEASSVVTVWVTVSVSAMWGQEKLKETAGHFDIKETAFDRQPAGGTGI